MVLHKESSRAEIRYSRATLFCCCAHSRRVRCLSVQELAQLEMQMGEDYRLNYRLGHACENDIGTLCGKDVCDWLEIPCGGKVLRCLVDKKDQIKDDSCKEEVFYFIKMQVRRISTGAACSPVGCALLLCCFYHSAATSKHLVNGSWDFTSYGTCYIALLLQEVQLEQGSRSGFSLELIVQARNFGNDIILVEQCKQDVDRFCSSVQPGNGRLLACLRSHRSELTPGCAAEELKLEMEESSNLELRTSSRSAIITLEHAFSFFNRVCCCTFFLGNI
jgi:golgi apparatus protein 1